MRPAKRINQDFTGAGPHVVELDPGYFNNQFEIVGDQGGAYTFRAWGVDGDDYGAVEDGTLTLPANRTLSINGAYLLRVEITPPGSGAFGVRGRQSAPAA